MQKLFYLTVHLLFWTTFIALSWMSVSSTPGEVVFLANQPGAVALLGLWGGISFYSFYYYFQPRFLDSKRYYGYLLISIIFSVSVSMLFVGIFWLTFADFRPHAWQKFLEGTAGSFLISQCGSLLRGFISWNQNLQNKAERENQSLRNELAMLKAQLSPHFLFNTLNNIDSLIYKSRDEASAMLIKLSDLLRYMLYESEDKEVPIEKEIDYIQQLVELQSLRFEQSDFVELKIENSSNQLTIAPLLFLPFIENAFKFVSKPSRIPAIMIHLNVNNDLVQMTCRNYFQPQNDKTQKKHQGIGLANARRRLELLYPQAFDLEVTEKVNLFEVNLFIQMS